MEAQTTQNKIDSGGLIAIKRFLKIAQKSLKIAENGLLPKSPKIARFLS
jgi:hypothetical protein